MADVACSDGPSADTMENGGGVKATPRVPIPGCRNVMVTSALPYVNNVPHLGNIIGCVLSADAYARYCRRRGYNTIFMCGTDEYGTTTETKAVEEGVTPREICDKYYKIHAEIYEWFNISCDLFGRTSTAKQTEIAQSIFTTLLQEKRLIEDSMEQPFCVKCARFLADRFVEGTCPNCAYEDARGDQCDKCGKLLNPADLVNARCKVCGDKPEIRKTEHLFLDLPALKPQLEEYIKQTSEIGGWSSNALQITNSWIRDGLKPRCITRDLKWGIPVPLEKYKDKSPKDVELVQFMGKDNVPFHTVIFPCTLLGTAEEWTMMKTISVCEYLNYESGKFSKSRGVGIFGNDAKETGIPPEVWRYYLLANRPEVSDAVFLWSDLQAKVNNELLANLGNFVNRCLMFINKPAGQGYGGIVPQAVDPEKDELTAALCAKVSENVKKYVEAMEKVKLKAGLKLAMTISGDGNQYNQDSKFWELYKKNPERCATVIATAAGLVRLLATLMEPFMPTFSATVLGQLNLPSSSLSLTDADVAAVSKLWELIPAGHRIGKPEPIFAEMSNEEVTAFREKFAGNQAERVAADLAAASIADPAADAKPAAQSKKGKKNAKEGGSAKVPAKPAAAAAPAPLDVSRLDLRVGLIKKCWKHPDADSLYVEEIDVGEAQPRTVVSGLVKYVPLEEMQNRKVVVLCNLKPVAMRGIKSHAMVMAASNADHSKVELVTPPEGAAPGERINFPGFSGPEPEPMLNPKKKMFEAVQPDFRTTSDLIACYKDVPFTTSSGACRVASIVGGTIQ
ncbi:hypothetical protein CBR_g55333 [Chara braunii]|uniref:methionine--tRNA ligase n=1 Tax=Chara braunii TaxID=69332 RepID=A0A388MCV7_CHABU|nr:hypothetical protein CBR_g55333 [Chara braunii]|eukprot:GBG92400.1 hypothetical protein CBR_g55333 [Chara braunii]